MIKNIIKILYLKIQNVFLKYWDMDGYIDLCSVSFQDLFKTNFQERL